MDGVDAASTAARIHLQVVFLPPRNASTAAVKHFRTRSGSKHEISALLAARTANAPTRLPSVTDNTSAGNVQKEHVNLDLLNGYSPPPWDYSKFTLSIKNEVRNIEL